MVSIFYNMVSRDPPNQSSRNSGNKWQCQLARPLLVPNFVVLWQEESMRDVRCGKFVLPEKWTKVQQNPLKSVTHQCLYLCQISSRSAKRCMRKALQFFYTFGAPGGPGSKFTDLGTGVQQGCLKFRPFVAAYPRDLLPNFVDFIESLTDRYYYYKLTVTTTTPCLKKRPTFGLL